MKFKRALVALNENLYCFYFPFHTFCTSHGSTACQVYLDLAVAHLQANLSLTWKVNWRRTSSFGGASATDTAAEMDPSQLVISAKTSIANVALLPCANYRRVTIVPLVIAILSPLSPLSPKRGVSCITYRYTVRPHKTEKPYGN